MRAAFIQFEPVHHNRAASLERAESLLADVDADLIVLPELFSTGYFFRSPDELAQLAEPLPGGDAARVVRRWAEEKDAVIVAGIAERDGDRLYNSALTASPGGRTSVYRKVHLYYEEKVVFQPGDSGFQIFDVTDRNGNPYRLGVMICFDWYFPEAARTLAVLGADVIAHPSNLVRKDCPRAMPIRALENHVYTVTANRIGAEENRGEQLRFIGQSLICSPSGAVLASAGREEVAVGVAEFDPIEARQRQINAHNDLLADRRPSMYRALQE